MSLSLTFKQATDEMLVMVKDAWDPTGHEMFWESVREQRETDDTPWASTMIRHATGRQITIGKPALYERIGTIIIMVYAQVGKGLSDPYVLAKILADAFEGKTSPSGVWFRNVRINEIGRDGQFTQVSLLVDFTYTEVK